MPVGGAKPKPRDQIRHRNRSPIDWTEVPEVPFDRPRKLPLRPGGGSWPAATRRWWSVVARMPHCTLWSDSDWQFAEHTARLVAAFDEGDLKLATEIRQRERKLGVTADDRRDLRIRYVAEAPTPDRGGEVARIDDYRDL